MANKVNKTGVLMESIISIFEAVSQLCSILVLFLLFYVSSSPFAFAISCLHFHDLPVCCLMSILTCAWIVIVSCIVLL